MRSLCRLSLVVGCLLAGLALAAPPGQQDDPPSPFRFTDATAEAGLEGDLHGAYAHSIAWGDFDNDDRLDLLFGTFADRSPAAGTERAPSTMLFRQLPGGKLERFRSAPVEVPSRSSGAVFADLDNDGDLDLYVSSNTKVTVSDQAHKRAAQAQLSMLYRNDGKGKFVDVSRPSGACPATLVRARDVGVLDYDGDGLLDLFVMQDRGIDPEDKINGLHFFRNLGGFKFEDVTSSLGLPRDLWSTGIVIADLNADRRPDFYLCGCNRLFLATPAGTYEEARDLRPVFSQPEKELDWVTGASLGDLDRDGDLDLITGRHHYFGPSRVHVYLNEGLKAGVPRFREITREVGLAPLPQKAPHPEIQDFDNDGIVDLYWSAFFARGERRWPFLCKGLGVRQGLPRFQVPSTEKVKVIYDSRGRVQSTLPADGLGMVYYVNGPAVDYDGDGDLDFLVSIWPDEPSRLFRNDTPGGSWLQVRVEGRRISRQGIGTKVSVYEAGKAGQPSALLGHQEITLNGGYSSGRPAVAHFGLGTATTCDVVLSFPPPAAATPRTLRGVKASQMLLVKEE